MPLPPPVIVVPGITATYLRDSYPLPPETIWSVMTKSYERAALHPDHLKETVPKRRRAFEAAQPALVVPDQAHEIAYKELIEELRFNLRDTEDEAVPVYVFGYDWRQPLEATQQAFKAFVDEVIERTKLLRHYHRAGYGDDPKVNLVGHSMGGLVIAGSLAAFGKGLRANKVVTLATPFQGSFEVVVKVTTGNANLGGEPPSSREREAARVTPGLYYLVPSFTNGLDLGPNLPAATLFDPSLWQGSIAATIAEYIRLRGRERMSAAQRLAMARDIFAAMLTAARLHRRRVDTLKLAQAGLEPNDWLCIVGVDADTRYWLRVRDFGTGPEFVFQQNDVDNFWRDLDAGTQRKTGDGTVPFEGAIPKFLPYESLVCLRPDDFGTWEIADKLALKAGGFHGILPNMNLIHRLIVRFFTGGGDPHGNTWGFPPPGILPQDWAPPMQLNTGD